jgi:nitroimidazol reductase NimA-like FMN-containing flavoprotein (pyridoxamine 5'-phosphate oxidase superfamily)
MNIGHPSAHRLKGLDMDVDTSRSVELLGNDECWVLLHSSSLGRLAVSVANEPNIYPVSFVADDRRLVFRTSQGTKLAELTVNSHVAFETDGVGPDEAWSVVVKGTAHALDKQSDIDAADELSLLSLIPTLRYVYVEITPYEVTGRRFKVGSEPDRY